MRFVPLLALLMIATARGADAQTPNHEAGAIVFVVDRSGSTYEELTAEKQAVVDAIAKLDPLDHVSLVMFNGVSTVVFADVPVSNRATIKKPMREVNAEGGTSVHAGLEAALGLFDTTFKRKHVILISEGMPEDDLDGLDVVDKMRDAGITVSCVGLSPDHDLRDLLAHIAGAGGGRLSMVRSLSQLSKIVTKEAQRGLK